MRLIYIMRVIFCDSTYSPQILEIFNDAIINSTALYDYEPRSLEAMAAWFESKKKGNYPVIGVVNGDDQLMGFGSYGTFRAWPAYKYSIEHSLYIHKDHRGKGLGKLILREIIKSAKRQDYHCLVAGIDASNQSSIGLHKSFGFEYCGKIRQAGYKFSKWLDLEFYQLVLETPLFPSEN